MPTSRRRTRQTHADSQTTITGTAVLDPPVEQLTEEQKEERIRARIDELMAMPFFAMLKDFSEAEWSQHSPIYIYRLEPRVVNADKPAYIDKVRQPIDEDYVRDMPGGGGGVFKLQINLFESEGKHIAKPREERIVIAGTPNYLPGQRFKDSNQLATNEAKANPAPSAAQPQASEPRESMVDLVNALAEALKKNNNDPGAAVQQVIETMKTANAATVEIMSSVAKRDASSGTGNPLMDRLLEAAIKNMEGGNRPAEKSSIQQLKELLEVQTLLRGPERDEPKTSLGQTLEELKLLGIDVIGSKGGGDGWKTQLGNAAIELVKNAPTLLQQLGQIMRENFERSIIAQREQFQIALTAHQVREGKLPAAAAVTAIPSASPPAASTPAKTIPVNQPAQQTPAAAPPAEGKVIEFPGPAKPAPAQTVIQLTEEEIMNKILEFVVMQFNAGTPGMGTAEVLDQVFPGAIEKMAPYFGNIENVTNFARTNSVLKEIVDHKDFPEFVEQFVKEVKAIAAGERDDDPQPPAA